MDFVIKNIQVRSFVKYLLAINIFVDVQSYVYTISFFVDKIYIFSYETGIVADRLLYRRAILFKCNMYLVMHTPVNSTFGLVR